LVLEVVLVAGTLGGILPAFAATRIFHLYNFAGEPTWLTTRIGQGYLIANPVVFMAAWFIFVFHLIHAADEFEARWYGSTESLARDTRMLIDGLLLAGGTIGGSWSAYLFSTGSTVGEVTDEKMVVATVALVAGTATSLVIEGAWAVGSRLVGTVPVAGRVPQPPRPMVRKVVPGGRQQHERAVSGSPDAPHR
jgi:hypothetical protein